MCIIYLKKKHTKSRNKQKKKNYIYIHLNAILNNILICYICITIAKFQIFNPLN